YPKGAGPGAAPRKRKGRGGARAVQAARWRALAGRRSSVEHVTQQRVARPERAWGLLAGSATVARQPRPIRACHPEAGLLARGAERGEELAHFAGRVGVALGAGDFDA